MSLILRNNLSRPLTHNELDGNFVYLNIAEWVKKGYLQGQYVLIKTNDIALVYYCEIAHTDYIYDQYGSGGFVDKYNDGNGEQIVWRKIGSDATSSVTGYTFNGTVANLALSDGTDLSININDVSIVGSQYSIGISNHSYQYITTGWTGEIISGETYNINNILFGSTIQAAKQNIVVVDLNTTSNNHHLIRLPNLTLNDAGIIYRVIVKSSNNTNLEKYLMVYHPTIRIISSNIKTKYNGSYFLPLETLESVEILWDGYDYIVTNMIKQGYVSLTAKNFFNMNINNDPLFDTCYIQRDINTFL